MVVAASDGGTTSSSTSSSASAKEASAKKAAEIQREQQLEQQRKAAEQRAQKLAQEALQALKEASQNKSKESAALTAVEKADPTALNKVQVVDASGRPLDAAQINGKLETQIKSDIAADKLPGLQIVGDATETDKTKPAQPAPDLSKTAVDTTVSKLHDALSLNKGLFAHSDKDESDVANLLSGLNQAQKQQVEQAYQKKYGSKLLSDVQTRMSNTDALKIQNILDKPDNGANYAGDLAVMISQDGSNHNSANGEIMKYLATLSSSQIQTMEKQYKQEFGKSFQDALNHDMSMGKNLQNALPILLKGADKRTASDDENLVKIVSQYGSSDGVDLVEAALGGNSDAAKQARKDISGNKALMSKLDSNYSGNDKTEVNEFVQNGQLSLTTIIGADHKNAADITTALQTATPQEQQQFILGQQLADSGQKPQNKADQQALDFYKQIHGALNQAGKPDQVAQWEASLTGNTFAGKLASNAKSTSKLLNTVENMSEQDWNALRDPKTGALLQAQLVDSIKGYASKDQQQQLVSLLKQKLTADSYADSQHVSQPFLQAVSQDKSDSNVVTALQHLSASDAEKYKDDPSFKKQVDDAIKGLDPAGKAYAESMLQQVSQSGKPPVENPLDTALSNVATGADKSQTLQSIQKALAANPDLLQKDKDSAQSPAEQALFAYAKKQMGNDDATNLFKSGTIPLDEQLKLGFPKDAVYTQLASASPSEQKEVLGKLDSQQKQLAESYIKQAGKPDLADQIRSYVLGNDSNYSQIGQQLQSMTPAQKSALYDEYSQKYGSSVSEDLLSKVPSTATQNFQDYLSMTAVNGQTDFANSLIENGDDQHKVEDGSAYTAIRATQQYADALQAANAFHQALTPQAIETLNSTVAQAQSDYQAAVSKYNHDHPGFWSEVGHIAEQVAVVAVSTAVTIGVGALTCGVGGAIAGGLTYSLLNQAVNIANGGSWDWTTFGEQAALGTVFAAGGAAVGVAKGVLTAGAETALDAGGDAVADATGSAVSSATRSAVETGTGEAAQTATETAAQKTFQQKLAEVSLRAGKNAVIGGTFSSGITAGTDLVTGHGVTAGQLLSSFGQGAVVGGEFSVAGDALAPVFAKAAPGLFVNSAPEVSGPAEQRVSAVTPGAEPVAGEGGTSVVTGAPAGEGGTSVVTGAPAGEGGTPAVTGAPAGEGGTPTALVSGEPGTGTPVSTGGETLSSTEPGTTRGGGGAPEIWGDPEVTPAGQPAESIPSDDPIARLQAQREAEHQAYQTKLETLTDPKEINDFVRQVGMEDPILLNGLQYSLHDGETMAPGTEASWQSAIDSVKNDPEFQAAKRQITEAFAARDAMRGGPAEGYGDSYETGLSKEQIKALEQQARQQFNGRRSGFDPLNFPGNGLEAGLDGLDPEVGAQFSGHGMAGDRYIPGTSGYLESLDRILANGPIPGKTFYEAPLAGAGEGAGAIGADRPFDDGPFVLVGDKGSNLADGPIRYVLVNDKYVPIIPDLQSAYPDVTFVPGREAPEFFSRVAQEGPETTAGSSGADAPPAVIPKPTGDPVDLGGGAKFQPWENGQIFTTPEGKTYVIDEAAGTTQEFDRDGNPVSPESKLSSLQGLVKDASSDAQNPEVRAAVKNAMIDALGDPSIDFKQLRDLIDGQGSGSQFDFIRGEEKDPDVVSALKARALYEVSQNPNVFTDNRDAIKQVFDDVQQGGDKARLERDVTNAINPDLTPEEKAAALTMLAEQNKPMVDQLLSRIDDEFGSTSKTNIKQFENTLTKAVRPDTLEDKPWYQVEHTRDSFRFKTTVDNIGDIETLVPRVIQELQDQGVEVLKSQPEKLLKPKLTGWRSFNLDLRFPNGQIAEYQITPDTLEALPDNHQEFEYLRTFNPAEATPSQIMEYDERLAAVRGVFNGAWENHLAENGMTEQQLKSIIDQLNGTIVPGIQSQSVDLDEII